MCTTRYILLFAFVFNQTFLTAQQSTGDTLFIRKDKKDGTAQSIYIDHSRNIKLYNTINQWSFNSYTAESFEQSKTYLKKNHLQLQKAAPILPYHKWIEIKQYRNNWYLYYPCDFYAGFRQSINDTSFIDWSGEGPVANKIEYQIRKDSNSYELKLAGVYNKSRTLSIYIIDTAKGIAVFKEFDNRAITQYYLMIAAEKINLLPMIVNNCELRKQEELEFEEPDYKALIKAKFK